MVANLPSYRKIHGQVPHIHFQLFSMYMYYPILFAGATVGPPATEVDISTESTLSSTSTQTSTSTSTETTTTSPSTESTTTSPSTETTTRSPSAETTTPLSTETTAASPSTETSTHTTMTEDRTIPTQAISSMETNIETSTNQFDGTTVNGTGIAIYKKCNNTQFQNRKVRRKMAKLISLTFIHDRLVQTFR